MAASALIRMARTQKVIASAGQDLRARLWKDHVGFNFVY
jgi:hypothetical protein